MISSKHKKLLLNKTCDSMFHLKSNQYDVNLNDNEMLIWSTKLAKILCYLVFVGVEENGTHAEGGVYISANLSRGQAGIKY